MAAQTKSRSTQTDKSRSTQTKTAAADVADGVEFDAKAIEEFNQKTIEDGKQAIEEFRKSVEEFNEKAIEDGKQAWTAYLDSYEKAALTAADLYEESVGSTDVELIKTVVATQARASRELTKAYVNAAREHRRLAPLGDREGVAHVGAA